MSIHLLWRAGFIPSIATSSIRIRVASSSAREGRHHRQSNHPAHALAHVAAHGLHTGRRVRRRLTQVWRVQLTAAGKRVARRAGCKRGCSGNQGRACVQSGVSAARYQRRVLSGGDPRSRLCRLRGLRVNRRWSRGNIYII